jgi:hypothetical protein
VFNFYGDLILNLIYVLAGSGRHGVHFRGEPVRLSPSRVGLVRRVEPVGQPGPARIIIGPNRAVLKRAMIQLVRVGLGRANHLNISSYIIGSFGKATLHDSLVPIVGSLPEVNLFDENSLTNRL